MNYYHELKEGEKVIKRQPTSLATENKDRKRMEVFHAKSGQEVWFVVSPTKEKIIN